MSPVRSQGWGWGIPSSRDSPAGMPQCEQHSPSSFPQAPWALATPGEQTSLSSTSCRAGVQVPAAQLRSPPSQPHATAPPLMGKQGRPEPRTEGLVPIWREGGGEGFLGQSPRLSHAPGIEGAGRREAWKGLGR